MKDNAFDDLVPARNKAVHQQHRKEVFWQITFPIILGSLLLLTACSLTVVAATGNISIGIWRDISLIWMLAPNLVLAIIPLILFAGMAYGVVRLIMVLPGVFFKIQKFFDNISTKSQTVSNRMASPIVKVGSLWAGLRKLWQ